MERIRFSNIAKLPSRFGQFNILSFTLEGQTDEHSVIFMGDLEGKKDVLMRIHSECLTGDAFGSLKCDCRDQLLFSMNSIADKGEGMIIYLRQEGRGIGLFNKVNAYALQDKGFDTVEANHQLGFETDLRTFDMVPEVLAYFGVESVALMSNNPEKIGTLQGAGIKVSRIVPVIMPQNDFNRDYLKVKKEQLNHLL